MIYFIKAGRYTKIGYTNGELSTRIASIQTGCPFKLELLFTIDGDIDKERMLHKQFSLYRGVGEWFDIPFDLDEEIVELALQQKPSGFVKWKRPKKPIKKVAKKTNGNKARKIIEFSFKKKKTSMELMSLAIQYLKGKNEFIVKPMVAKATKIVDDNNVGVSMSTVKTHWKFFSKDVDEYNKSVFNSSDHNSFRTNHTLKILMDAYKNERVKTKIQLHRVTKVSRPTIDNYWHIITKDN